MDVIFVIGAIFACLLSNSSAQAPPRLNIPGAVLVQQHKPVQYRQRLINPNQQGPIPRVRKPNQHPIPVPIRPVVEENEDVRDISSGSTFDDEVSKLGLSVLQSAVSQADGGDLDQQVKHIQFRPEKPIPILRQDVRENGPRGGPLFRQDFQPRQEYVQKPIQRDDIPVRQSVKQSNRQQASQSPPQSFRQPARAPAPRQPPAEHNDNHHGGRTRKPPVQILSKYRTDNDDGSITWGYENEDGTFKEETIGTDCVIRGKYGYVDPDGVRREYSYETGNKCDEPEEEEELLLEKGQQPVLQSQGRKPQLRPQNLQY